MGVSDHMLSERAVHAFKLVSYTVKLVKPGKKLKHLRYLVMLQQLNQQH